MKFETRPCTIEAIQWVGNTTEIKETKHQYYYASQPPNKTRKILRS